MAELVYAADLKSVVPCDMQVRLLLPVFCLNWKTMPLIVYDLRFWRRNVFREVILRECWNWQTTLTQNQWLLERRGSSPLSRIVLCGNKLFGTAPPARRESQGLPPLSSILSFRFYIMALQSNGRDMGLKISTVWVRIPEALLFYSAFPALKIQGV